MMKLCQFSLTRRYLVIGFSAIVLLSQVVSAHNAASQQRKRTFENKIPKHVPLEVKIKTDVEEKTLDLNNMNWFRDIEIEVTNTSNKPIYFISMNVIMPELLSERGLKMTFPLRFGSAEFFEHNNKPLPQDICIKPKATQVLTFEETFKIGYEAWRNRNNKSDPMKLELWINHLSFGDGTGFTSLGAVPFPIAQLPPAPGSASTEIKRTFHNAIPVQVPLKIKITKETEEKALDPNNRNWFRDIRIAVTNTSDKPIHFLSLWVEMTDVKDERESPMKFPLRYGRPDPSEQAAKALPQHVPIYPNATFVFAFEEDHNLEWELWRVRNNKNDPLALELSLNHLSFGDGSGFTSKQGNVFVAKKD